MNNKKFLIFVSLFFLECGYNNLSAKLNKFGISDIIPTHDDDNNVFDKRINEELAHGKLSFEHKSRRTRSFTIHDILKFIPKIQACFDDLLDHADNHNPQTFEYIRLAIIDVEKAKKMLRSKDVTPHQEHDLRRIFDPIKVQVNNYKQTDEVEGSSYINNKKYKSKKHDSSWTSERKKNSQI